jgi:hypothetical protein
MGAAYGLVMQHNVAAAAAPDGIFPVKNGKDAMSCRIFQKYNRVFPPFA